MKIFGMGVGTAFSSLVFAATIILSVEYNSWTKKLSEPVDNWFSVNHVTVSPTTPLDESPIVIIDQTTKQPFKSKWTVELQSVNTNGNSIKCADTLTSDEYVKLKNYNFTLDKIFGKDCIILPGKYRLYFLWIIDRGFDYPPAHIEKTSNIFEITAQK